MKKKIKVIFTGFETVKQAYAFTNWFAGGGEQSAGDAMIESTDIAYVETDADKFDNTINEAGEIIVPLKLFRDE